MENTGKVLFKDDSPKWYIAQGETWVGPLSATDIYQRVLSGEIGWADFVWKPGQSSWERICDLKDFQAAVPPPPTKEVRQEVKEASKPIVKPAPRRSAGAPELKPESKEWFLAQDDSHLGPFSQSEVERMVKIGTVHGTSLGWRDGMDDWIAIKDIPTFKGLPGVGKIPKPPAFNKKDGTRMARESERRTSPRIDQRDFPRKPLVAKILVTNSEQLAVAVCRDISVGGMQVLTDRIPGPVGSRIKLNVSSVGERGASGIEPFSAHGVVVRILEDGRGFSFRFDQLTDPAKKTIERYIDAR